VRPLFIGYTRGKKRLELTEADLETHVHGIGGTRSGKSKLIESIGRELIRNRQGFCLLDPHGYLYDDLVKWLAYIKPKREIILFNPSSDQRIVGFNPFLRGKGDLSTRVDRLIRATVKAWGVTSTDQTPRLERWLRCLYHTLLETGQTIDVLPYLFTFAQRNVAAYLTGAVSTDLIRMEWEGLASYTKARDFDDQLESTRNRLFRFLGSEQTLRIMGLPMNNLDLEDIIESGKILLVNLQPSDRLSDEQSRLIGTLLLNEIWEVGMRRQPDSYAKAPKSFYLIIDEFHKFLTPDIPDMLDQGAKYGIHLMLFHQRLDQLRARDPEAYSAVMAIRTKLVFGSLSRDDATAMVKEIYPGQVDLKKIKLVIEQTKFWPVYGRDKVYTHATGRTTGRGVGSGEVAGELWNPHLEEWVPSTSITATELVSTGDSQMDGVADIPIYHPEAFKEESNVQYYTLQEMLWQMADRLMEQYQRHFMIRRPGQVTEPALTPYVKSWYVKEERAAQYIDTVLSDFLTSTDVDRELKRRRLLLEANAKRASEPIIVESSGPKTRRRAPAKRPARS